MGCFGLKFSTGLDSDLNVDEFQIDKACLVKCFEGTAHSTGTVPQEGSRFPDSNIHPLPKGVYRPQEVEYVSFGGSQSSDGIEPFATGQGVVQLCCLCFAGGSGMLWVHMDSARVLNLVANRDQG